MDRRQKRERLELFQRLCRERGLPITPQRRIILEELLDLDDHPSADEVHERAVRRLPDTSRTTVYRALETLAGMGLIAKTSLPGRSVRYDRRTETHHHLVCVRCDTILDISDPGLDAILLPDTSDLGFAVSDHNVQIRGICRRCSERDRRRGQQQEQGQEQRKEARR
jgi:Fur family peroxide stress response transcriptional regulator